MKSFFELGVLLFELVVAKLVVGVGAAASFLGSRHGAVVDVRVAVDQRSTRGITGVVFLRGDRGFFVGNGLFGVLDGMAALLDLMFSILGYGRQDRLDGYLSASVFG